MRNLTAVTVFAMMGSTVVGPQSLASQTNDRYLLFFDWGRPDITSDASVVLDEAASAYRQSPGVKLQIAGYTDRSGSASHNLLASRRRAETVRAELVRRGVPANAMTVAAYGEQRPIVPTEDGVREVQNRRVEIMIEPPVR